MAEVRPRLPIAAALLALASLALFWPGYAMYDTVAQYGQVIDGAYSDWHPPAMARLWSLIGGGAAPMLALQLAGYWAGLGLVATRAGGRTGAAVLAIGALPLFAGWQAVVLKDAQMAGALLAATGIVAWWRLAGRRLPPAATAVAGLLIAYATLVRANAVFASVPLVVVLAPRPRGWMGKGLAIGAGVVAVLALSSFINHRLLAARHSGVERTQAIYDLSGIAVRAGPNAAATGLLPAETAELIRKACVRPYFWDPLGDAARCNDTVDRLRQVPVGTLYATLANAILHHPFAYAAHRLAHLNSTERWLVPWRWPGAAPPRASEPNELGLASPARPASWWQVLAGWIAETPLGWPIAWATLAVAALAEAGGRAATPACDLARALLVSALCLEASFALLSIASDLRYHLWPMIAAALATALLLGERAPRRRVRIAGGVALALVLAAGIGARLVLPISPQSYVGMLG